MKQSQTSTCTAIVLPGVKLPAQLIMYRCVNLFRQLACHFTRLSLFQLHLWLLCGGGCLCIALGGCQSRSWQLGVQHVAVHERGNHSNQAYSAWLHGPQLQEPRSQQCLHTTPRLSHRMTHTRQERRVLRCTESSHTMVVMLFTTLGRHKLQTEHANNQCQSCHVVGAGRHDCKHNMRLYS